MEALRNIAERYEGYGRSIQSVMQQKGRVPGIRGVVADIISTKAEYETAIETALGSRIQNIVTDSEDTAKQLIEYLKRNREGRATFLPLDALTVREEGIYREARGEKGVLGLGSELVSFPEGYGQLAAFLLGGSLIVDNIDNALRIAGKFRHRLRIITLEGELLTPGGAISGGAFRSGSNLMSRKRELDDLENRITALEKRDAALKKQLSDTEAELSAKASEVGKLEGELQEIALERNSLSIGIVSDLKLRLSSLSQKTDFLEENIARLEEDLNRVYADLNAAESGISSNRSMIEEREGHIAELKGHIESAKAFASGDIRIIVFDQFFVRKLSSVLMNG